MKQPNQSPSSGQGEYKRHAPSDHGHRAAGLTEGEQVRLRKGRLRKGELPALRVNVLRRTRVVGDSVEHLWMEFISILGEMAGGAGRGEGRRTTKGSV